jgi:hypothetical protein
MMAIECRNCKYLMNKSEILGYVLSDLYNFTKETLLPYLFKRGLTQDIILRFSNEQKIACPVCFKYEGWIKES